MKYREGGSFAERSKLGGGKFAVALARCKQLRPDGDQALWNFATGTVNPMLAVPLDSLFQRRLWRHLVPVVPGFVHWGDPTVIVSGR